MQATLNVCFSLEKLFMYYFFFQTLKNPFALYTEYSSNEQKKDFVALYITERPDNFKSN